MGACVSSAVPGKVVPPSKEGSPNKTVVDSAASHEISERKLAETRRLKQTASSGNSAGNNSPSRHSPSSRAPKQEKQGSEAWGPRRRHLCTDEMTLTEFCKELRLPAHKVRDALTFFQSLDTDRNGVISREEFAAKIHLSKVKVGYALSSVDTDADEQICFREFLVAAVHCVEDASVLFKSRFCFQMIDRKGKGAAAYSALHQFLTDTLYTEDASEAPRPYRRVEHEQTIHKLMQDDMGLEVEEKIKEKEFLAVVATHPEQFHPMLQLWKSLSSFFKGAFVKSEINHSFLEVERYFYKGGVGVAALAASPPPAPGTQEDDWGYTPAMVWVSGELRHSGELRSPRRESPRRGAAGTSPGRHSPARRSREGSPSGHKSVSFPSREPAPPSPLRGDGSPVARAYSHDAAADAFKQRASMRTTSSLKVLRGGLFGATFGKLEENTVEDEELSEHQQTRIFIKSISKPHEVTQDEEEVHPVHESLRDVARGRAGRPKSAEISAHSMSTHSFSGGGSLQSRPSRYQMAQANKESFRHRNANEGGRSASPLRKQNTLGMRKDPMASPPRMTDAPTSAVLHW